MVRDLKEEIYESEKTLKRTLELIQQDDITEGNIEAISNFIDDARSRGLSGSRLVIIAHHLRRLGKLTTADFKAFTEKDAKQLMISLGTTAYSEWTKLTCKKLFKQLMRSLNIPEDVFKWVKAEEPPSRLRKEDLLTPHEVARLVVAAPDNMWRALLSLLAEYGCRPGEALNLKVKDVIVNGNHIKLYVAGKMAKKQGPRPIFLFKSREVIKAWLAEHPQKNNPEAPLWLTQSTGNLINLRMLNTVFKHIANRAGITKRCYPYLLRHCKGTEVYLKYPPAVAMKIMGHDDAETGLVYTHLAEEDVLGALKKENGIDLEESIIPPDSDKCESCGFNNPYGSIQCNNCKAPLGAAGAIQFEQQNDAESKAINEIKELLGDPQVMSLLKQLKDPATLSNIKKPIKII